MSEMRKITVEVPEADLTAAQDYLGTGITETVREALKRLAAVQAQREAMKLRGKISFGIDLMALRKLED